MIPQTAAPPPGTGGVQREMYCSSGFANSTRPIFETSLFKVGGCNSRSGNQLRGQSQKPVPLFKVPLL
jgi:hypothetical protein